VTAATPAFRWTEKYSVNIAAIDKQHQLFFATINELNEALGTGQGASVINAVLQRLVEHARTHFEAEEKLMTEYDFPGLSTHRAEHERFTKSVAKLLEDHRAGKPGVPVSLLLFLQTWLKEHILVADKAYSSFFSARGVH
jgi:hemerythrin